MNDIGERIRRLRKENNMTVDELAKRIGKNKATVYRYENGFIENAPYTILVPIAQALNTSVDVLLGFDEKKIDLSKYAKENEFTDDELKETLEYMKFLKAKRKGE